MIKIFWFALFAMALPAQAVAYFAQSESNIGARLLEHTRNKITSNQSDVQPSFDVSDKAQRTDSHPVYESENRVNIVALINVQRWGISACYLDDADPDDLDPYFPDANLPLHKLYSCPIVSHEYWIDDALTTHHRISGWKDSNALYVALNGQFA